MTSKTRVQNPIIDSLRLFFVLAIVGFHYWPDEDEGWATVFSFGQAYVTFFFVLSGYLTHRSAQREWTNVRRFALRRVCSLAPLYFTTLILCVLIEFKNGRYPVAAILADALLIQAWIPGLQLAINPPAWFMSALVFCLMCYPVIRLIGRGSRIALRGGMLIYWFIIQALMFWFGFRDSTAGSLYLVYYPPVHLASFWFGVAAADRGREASEISSFCAIGLSIAAGFLLVVGLPVLYGDSFLVPREFRATLAAPVFAALVAGVSCLPSFKVTALNGIWFSMLGGITFPVYLFQDPVMRMFERIVVKFIGVQWSPGLFGAYLLVLVILSASWWFFNLCVLRLRLRDAASEH